MNLHWYIYIWAMSWENLFLPYANNKGTDKPACPRSLISAFGVRCLDSTVSSFYICNFVSLASFCGCTGWFESYLVANPEDRFSCEEAHLSHIMRKPDFWDAPRWKHKPVCSASEAAQMCRLICAFVVCIWHETDFLMTWPIRTPCFSNFKIHEYRTW